MIRKKFLLTLQIILGFLVLLFNGSYLLALLVTDEGLSGYTLLVYLFIPFALIAGGFGWLNNKKWGKVLSIIGLILALPYIVYNLL